MHQHQKNMMPAFINACSVFAALFALSVASFADGGDVAVSHRSVRTYQIDLDAPPETRYNHIVKDTENGFNTTVWAFYNSYFANDKLLTGILYNITDKRGPETPEMQAEIEGMASISGLPVKFVKSIQMLYELQTLMIPIVNFSKPSVKIVDEIPAGYEALTRIPWRGPGCTGIIATGSDGSTWHARNLDFSPVDVMSKLVYNAVFMRGGKEVFRSQMVAGYTMAITGARMGPDGFAIERNTRYTDHSGGNSEMLKNLESGVALNGWTLRKILENQPNYESALVAIKSEKYTSTEYTIISGVRKGAIVSRNPTNVAYLQTLGQPNFEERSDYIIITNFDFFFHDVREWFDPTGHGGFGKPMRRVAAQTILNATSTLTPDLLWTAINAQYVIADTVFQALINVEHGVWNISQPVF